MLLQQLNPVGCTSLWVAAMRAIESERLDPASRMFEDPYARVLAGQEGFDLLSRSTERMGDLSPVIAVRTRFYDEQILEAIAEGIRQIVILAAGMDARAFRLALPEDAIVFEIDREEVLAFKEAQLAVAEAYPRCRRTLVGADLTAEWAAHLARVGMDPTSPTLWLIEGLLMYLEESSIRTVFRNVDSIAAPGSIILFDVLGRTILESSWMERQKAFLTELQAPCIFGTDDPESLTAPLGWEITVTEPSQVAPSYQRWPYPSVPGIPSGFYIKATKPTR